MTQENDKTREVMATVLVFDICSSTDILEDLHRTENVYKWRNLLIRLKEFLVKEGKLFPFHLYNFTGDGWLLRFEYNIDGRKLLPFIQRLSAKYESLYRVKILPLLDIPSEVVGITLGMDRGRLIEIRMNNRDEYVGRPLNVACRLQSAIKDRDPKPANKMLMTKHLYNWIKDDVTSWKFSEAERTLRNIAGGKKLHCMKLLSIEAQKKIK